MAKRKKKPRIGKTVLIILIVLASVVTANWMFNNYYYRPSFKHYAAFGIDLPVAYGIHGVDVSHHQKNISWKEVKKMEINGVKIGFAFIKATEGTDLIDEHFGKNWAKAQNQKITKGAYHFFNATTNPARQAKNFLQRVKLQPGDLPPVLDIEQDNGVAKILIQKRVKEWLQLVEKEYNVQPIIYTNVDFYNRFLSPQFDGYPLWIAHYFANGKPRIGRKWSFWQHSETGHVNGIDAFVDFNVFNGDSSAFKKLLLKE
ncbi:MAG: glycoside hydrolase family 25 protein [Chitinophagaceae bacterium]|nr:glycoside hydrolase family 25 protein [Chitinophagaceae bacterium]